MPDAHARLAPSASARWLSCPASVLLVEALPRERTHVDTPWTREGTIAHKLGELLAGKRFGLLTTREFTREYKIWQREAALSPEDLLVMRDFVERYVEYLGEVLEENPGSRLMLEQKIDTGVPSSWGTSDAVIVAPRKVIIVDLKYGQGVVVSAVDNPQLMLYGVGALDMFGDLLDTTEEVSMTIFQPRVGHRSTFTMDADDLRAWRDSIQPIAARALEPGANFGPSEKACRFCPLAGECRAQLEWATTQDFEVEIDLLSEAEIAEAYARMPGIKAWLESLERRALTMAYSEGRHLPGFKVVLTGGRRSIKDDDAAVEKLMAAGFEAEQVARFKVRALGELEKIVGKTKLPEILGDTIIPPVGKPALVPESDKREAISPASEAALEFEVYSEE